MSIPFNDTTTKSGLIQDCEFWTNLGDTVISGDSTLLKRFTGLINRAFDEVMPIIFLSDSKWQFDDANHTDNPIATTSLVSGQADYPILSDGSGNSVLEIHAVFVQGPDGTWRKLDPVDSHSDVNTSTIFAQNSTNRGTPTRYDKIGTVIWLDPTPNYAATGGIRAVFSRSQSYFASDATSKTPGIPSPFHRLLSKIASRDWLAVNKPEAADLLNIVTSSIAEDKTNLAAFMSKRSRDEKTVIRARTESSR